MSKEKTALFLADCLSNMPDQPEQFQSVVNTAIAGLTRIADGSEWPRDEVRAVVDAARAAAWAAAEAAADAAVYAARAAAMAAAWDATYWSAADAAAWARAADNPLVCTVKLSSESAIADRMADWAALAHPDPAAERARQAAKRKELGLNTKGAK